MGGVSTIIERYHLEKSVVFTGASQSDDVKVIVKPIVKLQITHPSGECNTDAELILENKDPDNDWAIIDEEEPEVEVYGVLRYSTEGEEFCYDFEGYGLENEEYSLIYYADTEDRFNDWGGDNPGALIASGTAVDGTLTLSGSVDLGMDLPHPDDANGDINNHDYSGPPDYYTNATGAKIWLVPSSAYDAGAYKVISWEPNRFLFETDLITYDDTDVP